MVMIVMLIVMMMMMIVMCVQGSGILVSEDDTTFQGEFSDDWTLSGKVRSHWRSTSWVSCG